MKKIMVVFFVLVFVVLSAGVQPAKAEKPLPIPQGICNFILLAVGPEPQTDNEETLRHYETNKVQLVMWYAACNALLIFIEDFRAPK